MIKRFRLLSICFALVALYAGYEVYDYYRPIAYTTEKCVIFDFDGTIGDAFPVFDVLYQRVTARLRF